MGVVFGSQQHLRVQYQRLGLCEGVPLVSFTHEAAVSDMLHV
jgi:hypothetical protein